VIVAGVPIGTILFMASYCLGKVDDYYYDEAGGEDRERTIIRVIMSAANSVLPGKSVLPTVAS
jgi:hypothetical protein